MKLALAFHQLILLQKVEQLVCSFHSYIVVWINKAGYNMII